MTVPLETLKKAYILLFFKKGKRLYNSSVGIVSSLSIKIEQMSLFLLGPNINRSKSVLAFDRGRLIKRNPVRTWSAMVTFSKGWLVKSKRGINKTHTDMDMKGWMP
ncbi:hypothetical protein BDZ94DRAFT_1238618 [Collybia nuda]|uniref:Uncharacterized protein n=1 Tax=Collybia nuda TaxID=64659 RepID=A0A9P6CC36_9AGAR|nr:hypothetical protein BDZ94DRAFT_1238618 [Collybia nuda]